MGISFRLLKVGLDQKIKQDFSVSLSREVSSKQKKREACGHMLF